MPKKLARLTLKEQADKALREMISSYRFLPGKWINVERLAKDLGVSRTPVWQAMMDLEKEGLVEHIPNQGIRMAEMTLQMAYDLYTVRGLLEGLAGRFAAENINKRTVGRLESIIGEQKKMVENQDVVGYSKSDFRFHGLIYETCGNWLLRDLLENIKARARPFVCDIRPIISGLYQDHIEAVDAMRNHDPARAERVMRKHNLRMRRRIEWTQEMGGRGMTNGQ
ncbi:MAG: GntR family transcriptional regulator [Deltaproteobacteria bacterium]|nr:MAG: GntR family transcriptional regulator [Deltaproteobacteria bacterium]